MNRNRKKAAAAGVAAGMAVVLGAGSVMAAGTGENNAEVEKEETVYVNTTAGGEVTNVTVSDWLKNSGDISMGELQDASDLKDIKNVKGEETFSQDGNSLIWNTDGEDIYYQGTTDKELPVSMSIRYYLDGTEISPDDLAGRSGHLKIEVSYTNHAKTTRKINGKNTEIYLKTLSLR